MTLRTCRRLSVLLTLLSANAVAQDAPLFDLRGLLDQAFAEESARLCESFAPMPVESCTSIIAAAKNSFAGESADGIKATLKEELTNPDFLNSALSKAFGGGLPLGLEFKALDGQNGDTVLGLAYAIDYEFASTDVSERSKWNRNYAFALNATGTVTENGDENPRNLLESKITAFGTYSTKIPQQSDEFGERLTAYALATALCEGNPETQECQDAADKGFAMLDSTTEFLSAFQYYEFGLDAGLESDQDFDAQQTSLSAYLFGQYESWGNQSLLDILNVSPSARIGLDSIDPNDDTPRAIAGDSSSFYRFSGELSLWIPLQTRVPLALTFNYRYYKELGASSAVEDANLDSFNLRTVSLTGTNGIFASYSSGRLPLDMQNDNVLEIGWRTYF